MNGTWQTTGSGSGRGVLIVLAVLVLLGSGAAAELAAAVIAALIATAVVVVLAIAALTVFLVYRARHPAMVSAARIVPVAAPWGARNGELPAPQRPALEAPAARELHLHFHGTDPEQVAEILRRHDGADHRGGQQP